jgi:hypothetical protein
MINPIMDKIQWSMHGTHPRVEDAYVFDYNVDSDVNMYNDGMGDYRKQALTSDEVNAIVHPSGDWLLVLQLDERALKGETQYQYNDIVRSINKRNAYEETELHSFNMTRYLKFGQNAKVHTVLERIAGGLCYGYFEGITALNSYNTMPNWHSYYESICDKARGFNIPLCDVYRLQWGT